MSIAYVQMKDTWATRACIACGACPECPKVMVSNRTENPSMEDTPVSYWTCACGEEDNLRVLHPKDCMCSVGWACTIEEKLPDGDQEQSKSE